MKILIDTNIVLDVLLAREPWGATGRKLWQANDSGHVTATTLTDIFYVTRRMTNNDIALQAVKSCLLAFEIVGVSRKELEDALMLSGRDFEDNLQITCATLAGLDAIVTGDPQDFQTSTIPVWTPEQGLTQLPSS